MSVIGQLIIAPEGYRLLRKGCEYRYLGRSRESGAVRLVSFAARPARADIHTLTASDFEEGLEKNYLVQQKSSAALPPWLAAVEGLSLEEMEDRRASKKQSLHARIQQRLAQIQPLLARQEDILASSSPEREINRYAASASPKLNAARVRLWFFSYLTHGLSPMALLPPFCAIGCWPRKLDVAVKYGRESLDEGARHGNGLDPEMLDRIYEGYRKKAKLGVTMVKICTSILTEQFGCRPRRRDGKPDSKAEFYHPEGLPFPSPHQISYRLHKKFGLRQIQIALYGAIRVRTRLSASLGKFSEGLSNLMQKIEGDAYRIKSIPQSPVPDATMRTVCVVRLRCMTSGMLGGIGFSIGGERAEAYRAALFCAAMDKVEFCALFGIVIEEGVWPCQGLSSELILDRGPGAKRTLVEDEEFRIPIRDLAPSRQGQSKAGIESSHPRQLKTEGEPDVLYSDLTYFDLARQEIFRTIRDNSRIQSDRRTPNMIKAGVIGTPISIWNYLSARLRTSAHPVSMSDAIRNFLTPVEFTMQEDGAYLEGTRFDSAALRATGLHDRTLGGRFRVSGFSLTMCLRKVWIEVNGRLVDAEPMLPIRDDERQLFLSLSELQEISALRAKLASGMTENTQAVDAEFRERMRAHTGKEPDNVMRKSGHATKQSLRKTAVNQAVEDMVQPKRSAA
jgi:hypothetical protein